MVPRQATADQKENYGCSHVCTSCCACQCFRTLATCNECGGCHDLQNRQHMTESDFMEFLLWMPSAFFLSPKGPEIMAIFFQSSWRACATQTRWQLYREPPTRNGDRFKVKIYQKTMAFTWFYSCTNRRGSNHPILEPRVKIKSKSERPIYSTFFLDKFTRCHNSWLVDYHKSG
jgi:hypothetical protein